MLLVEQFGYPLARVEIIDDHLVDAFYNDQRAFIRCNQCHVAEHLGDVDEVGSLLACCLLTRVNYRFHYYN